MQERPNIVLVMTDEHDPAVTGCYGDPVVETPNIDRLAREGITFDAAYTTSPLCVPARLSFTAGKYVSKIHAWNNSSMLPSEDYPSLPRILNDAGYETVLCGKMHYDRNRRYGFTRDLIPGANKHKKMNVGRRRDPGDLSENLRSWTRRTSDFRTGETSKVIVHDEEVSREAIKYIESRNETDKPFFLLVGYLAPHFPLIVPPAFHEKYKDRIPPPEIPDGLLERLPLNYKHLRAGFGMTRQDPEIVKLGRELYWGLVDWMDGQVGRIIDAIERSAVKDDTIVIFTSDHGENKGDHGLWWKNNMYEHSARIPLIFWYPRCWPGNQRRQGACSLVDLTQTIADLCGAKVPADWDGDSLLPYLEDPNHPWKDIAVSEYHGHNVATGVTMIRNGNLKYVYHNKPVGAYGRGAEIELYDLSSDPKEFQNLAGDPAYNDDIRRLHHLMVKELGREPDEIEGVYRASVANFKSKALGMAMKLYGALWKKKKGRATRKASETTAG